VGYINLIIYIPCLESNRVQITTLPFALFLVNKKSHTRQLQPRKNSRIWKKKKEERKKGGETYMYTNI